MKTENLAIILTDIVGYTEATSRLSRKEQKEMLHLHNQLLYPIIRNFGGQVVKTIGDALLLAFRSPTDAMLCSMAMQDALYDFNRRSHSDQHLHIRIAASLGEVRVARNDVFGEAVNLTSRIESITPEDEIYLSEAIYLAMNKAEVPCVEIGLKQLKGIAEPVRIWQIPRFTRARLVPEQVGEEELSELSYPYGGAHLDVESRGGISFDRMSARKHLRAGLAALALVAIGVVVWALPTGTFSTLLPSEKPAEVAESSPAPAAADKAPALTAEPVKVASAAPVKAPEEKAVKPVVQKTEAKPAVSKKTVTAPAPVVTTPPAPAVKPHAKLIAQIESDQGTEMRTAARRIARKRITAPAVLDQVAQGLERNYQKNVDRTTADALAWYCKVLGASGNRDYLPILDEVAKKTSNRKLKGYATKSLAQLQQSTK